MGKIFTILIFLSFIIIYSQDKQRINKINYKPIYQDIVNGKKRTISLKEDKENPFIYYVCMGFDNVEFTGKNNISYKYACNKVNVDLLEYKTSYIDTFYIDKFGNIFKGNEDNIDLSSTYKLILKYLSNE